MRGKIGGWQRLWIFLSVMYLFVVAGFAVFIYYSSIKEEVVERRILSSIEIVLPELKEKDIKDAMAELKEYLSKNQQDIFDDILLEDLVILNHDNPASGGNSGGIYLGFSSTTLIQRATLRNIRIDNITINGGTGSQVNASGVHSYACEGSLLENMTISNSVTNTSISPVFMFGLIMSAGRGSTLPFAQRTYSERILWASL